MNRRKLFAGLAATILVSLPSAALALSAVSQRRLGTVHPELRRLFRRVDETIPCLIVSGYRNREEQNAAVAAGHSLIWWPHSLHNTSPSYAVDVMPLPLDWDDASRAHAFGEKVLPIAEEMGIPIRWGGHWHEFYDPAHFELAP